MIFVLPSSAAALAPLYLSPFTPSQKEAFEPSVEKMWIRSNVESPHQRVSALGPFLHFRVAHATLASLWSQRMTQAGFIARMCLLQYYIITARTVEDTFVVALNAGRLARSTARRGPAGGTPVRHLSRTPWQHRGKDGAESALHRSGSVLRRGVPTQAGTVALVAIFFRGRQRAESR